MKKLLALFGAMVCVLGLTSCGGESGPDLSEEVELKINLSYGNMNQVISYLQSDPLELPDKTTVSSGQLKPMWAYVGKQLNTKIVDAATPTQKSNEMFTEVAGTNFTSANIYGGNNLGGDLMSQGALGKFVALDQNLNKLPNFKKYLDANPNIKSAITAYDGHIYHIPYIAEIGEIARAFTMREDWVVKLLDGTSVTYDATSGFETKYEGFYVGANARTGANGGTVTPKTGVNVEKKKNENIILIQNSLSVKSPENMTKALIQYIKDNYSYTKPSELYLGEKAAYDIDELVALWRCIRLNPRLLTGSSENKVYPYFTRQSSYREEVLRFATYFGGVKVHGSDSYGARWYIDENDKLQYTYSQESLYNVLIYLAQIQAEELIYPDTYKTSEKANFRSFLYGVPSVSESKKQYGFMTYDFTASTTADALSKPEGGTNQIVGVLPPVAKVNNAWQYYMDNSRVIKPDGWAISIPGSSQKQIDRALVLFDYFFSEDGAIVQNYALPDMLDTTKKFQGPDGKEYPAYNAWFDAAAKANTGGDYSTFLRNYVGCLFPIGYQKEIGFEYQYTSQNGFNAWALMKNSTLNIPTYAGDGLKPAGSNPNYYKLIPPVFSFTEKDLENIAATKMELSSTTIFEEMFNIIRYKYDSSVSTDIVVHQSYTAYLNAFKDNGLENYVKVYQAAYERTKV